MLGTALTDYYAGLDTEPLWVESDRADTEAYQKEAFFADFEAWNPIEQRAIELCRGHVLDVGAGAGRHSLELQKRDSMVTAVEADAALATLCAQRGVLNVINQEWQQLKSNSLKIDTILLLMNGMGLAGYHNKLLYLARFCHTVLPSGGLVLADSSEISYLPPSSKNYRLNDEIYFRFGYKGAHSAWFSWLFAAPGFAKAVFTKAGFDVTIITIEGEDRYLLHAKKR